jgi:hypothetical protein
LNIREEIQEMVKQHAITVAHSPLEKFGDAVTRLADDHPVNDDTDRALMTLVLENKIEDEIFLKMCHAWQLEKCIKKKNKATFDPFGDFETAGYLRNSQREKIPPLSRPWNGEPADWCGSTKFPQRRIFSPWVKLSMENTSHWKISFDSIPPRWSSENQKKSRLPEYSRALTGLVRARPSWPT